MNAHTRDKKRWHRELMAWYDKYGIGVCEYPGCNSTFGIAPAHRVKQRFIRDREEYFMAAYLCQAHHHYLEYGTRDEPGTHERMYEAITEIITNRQC